MDNNTSPDGLFHSIYEIREQLLLLGIAGIGGAFFRAVLAPEMEWKRRISQGLGGALSALFLGGIAANISNQIYDGGTYTWLAWGFIMGTGGEVAVKFIQDKLMGGKK